MKALVLGVSGQDGYYLSEYLASLNYEVWGIDVVPPEFAVEFRYMDIRDTTAVRDLILWLRPDEIYNLAALIRSGESWSHPWDFFEVNVHGLLNILQTVAEMPTPPRVFQATSSGIFGNALPPQSEETPHDPLTPYDASKLAAHNLARQYRAAHRLPITCGILFQHASPRQRFGVLHKIAAGVAAVATGNALTLSLGNLSAIRDFGHAKDYVRAMHLTMQQEPGDWCIGTGIGRTIGQMAETAFQLVGLRPSDHNEHYLESDHWPPAYLTVADALLRKNDTAQWVADATKIRDIGWRPTISFEAMLMEMMQAEGLEAVRV